MIYFIINLNPFLFLKINKTDLTGNTNIVLIIIYNLTYRISNIILNHLNSLLYFSL